MNPAV